MNLAMSVALAPTEPAGDAPFTISNFLTLNRPPPHE